MDNSTAGTLATSQKGLDTSPHVSQCVSEEKWKQPTDVK